MKQHAPHFITPAPHSEKTQMHGREQGMSMVARAVGRKWYGTHCYRNNDGSTRQRLAGRESPRAGDAHLPLWGLTT